MMRKLTSIESAALYFLDRDGPCCPGADSDSSRQLVRSVLDGLVRKKYATDEATDDGPRYTATPIGRTEAAKIEAAG